MNPHRIAGLVSVLFAAAAVSGCSGQGGRDSQMFEHWADSVAAIPIDAAHAAPAAKPAPVKQAAAKKSLKIDVVDRLDSASAKLGLGAAASFVESRLADLRQKMSTSGPAPSASDDAETAGGWTAQLAAFPTRDAAESAWARLKANHPDVLSGLTARFEPVDLGGRGVWTRVQAGPFPSRTEAEAVCAGAGVSDRWCVGQQRG